MNRFFLENTFIKIYIYHFSINIFIKTRSQKLYFGDRVAVQTNFIFEYGGSMHVLGSDEIIKYHLGNTDFFFYLLK